MCTFKSVIYQMQEKKLLKLKTVIVIMRNFLRKKKTFTYWKKTLCQQTIFHKNFHQSRSKVYVSYRY